MERYFYTITLSLLIGFLQAQTPWTRITPAIQEHQINKLLRIPGTSTVFGACDGSTIIKSSNAGESWEIILQPAGMDARFRCLSLAFLNSSIGFLGGTNLSILKTTNGGNTWSLKYEDEPGYLQDGINDIAFFNNDIGLAVAKDGYIVRTTDGGDTWTRVESGTSIDLNEVDIVNETTAFATGWSAQMLKTTDAGLTWTLLDPPSNFPEGQVENMIFINDTTGFVLLTYWDAVSEDHYIFKTTDGGLTWNESLMQPTIPAYDGCFAFYDDQHIAMISNTWGYCGNVTLTENGGENWTELYIQTLNWFQYALTYTDDHTLLCGGNMGMLSLSTDGGYTWNPIDGRQIQNDIYDVQFVSNTTGFLLSASYGGGIPGIEFYKTTDGGLNWTRKLNGGIFYFLDSLNGFKIDGEWFESTMNGGDSWELISELPSGLHSVSDMKFYDALHGMVVGEEVAFRTFDGGLTWQEVTPELATFYDIEYKTSDLVYITNDNSAVLISPDNGTTWQKIYTGPFGSANDLLLATGDTAFLVCSKAILKSTDGCITWHEVYNSTPDMEYMSISFPDRLNGYIVGGHPDFEGCIMLKTTDGGATWYPIFPPVTSPLTCTHFFNNDKGLIFGKYGVSLLTTTGGIVGTSNIPPPEGNTLFISPNPFTGEFMILQPVNGASQLEITDLTGRKVLTQTLNENGTSVNTSTLGKGVYIITLTTKEGHITSVKGIHL